MAVVYHPALLTRPAAEARRGARLPAPIPPTVAQLTRARARPYAVGWPGVEPRQATGTPPVLHRPYDRHGTAPTERTAAGEVGGLTVDAYRFCVIGPGRLGSAALAGLQEAELTVTAVGVHGDDDAGLLTALPRVRVRDAALEADAWWLAVPDDEIHGVAGRLAEALPATPQKRPAHGVETVLVVEDQAQVRSLACRILSEHGYKVVEAASGEAALDLSTAMTEPIHLLVTDVVMTGIDGKELLRRLESQRPGIRVLFMSGYTTNVIGHHGVLDPDVDFIQKPFSLDSFATKVREILDRA